jgi:hypothetical protein
MSELSKTSNSKLKKNSPVQNKQTQINKRLFKFFLIGAFTFIFFVLIIGIIVFYFLVIKKESDNNRNNEQDEEQIEDISEDETGTNTEDQTGSSDNIELQTYKSENCGFTLKYPENYIVDVSDNSIYIHRKDFVVFGLSIDCNPENTVRDVSGKEISNVKDLRIMNKVFKRVFYRWPLDKKTNYGGFLDSGFVVENVISEDNINAKIVICDKSFVIEYLAPGGDYFYEDLDNIISDLDKVIESFVVDEDQVEEEVIKGVVTDSLTIQGWKVYKNEDYGFTFEYPGDWGNVTEEGEPYDEEGCDVSCNLDCYDGFTVLLKKGNWSYLIEYSSYWDDIAGYKMGYEKKFSIYNKDRMRVGYLNWDNPRSIDFIQIIELNNYEKNKPEESGSAGTFDDFGIMLDDKAFIIKYIPNEKLTYDISKDIIEEMDQISQTLSLI